MDALPEELQLLIVEKLCLMPGFPRALAAFSATARGPRARLAAASFARARAPLSLIHI